MAVTYHDVNAVDDAQREKVLNPSRNEWFAAWKKERD